MVEEETTINDSAAKVEKMERAGTEEAGTTGFSDRSGRESGRGRESEGGVAVIRAGRTLSDRNGAIIRGSRDVKRSALCARRCPARRWPVGLPYGFAGIVLNIDPLTT